ncbi:MULTISPECIES: DUF3141 domain-containing protein [unclassified Bradyrhizobium]|uniref:DUF3141 domain-containing protein n=1 Tax=unclassified Bradyrhizobium TaxID=2631580 RepID=UPI00247B13BF|nr:MULTISPECIES: DUF3141 domain-containing protein [unclassified Bradyrhizobium]WGR68650.1 DUF3141 domain-containing protein [Bradyrhizobium sp. ISRA426]WGR80705.1 DUF3141 domain-containing protein [Bradyrhizobium sp. ISRA430]WGR83890.1 DUF3141 domain-containing protein [Bradyrhizobium sp. ISRA432]
MAVLGEHVSDAHLLELRTAGVSYVFARPRASLRPKLFGPLIIAGAPLAYWVGMHGKYPMRYSGGLLGGSWLTALTSDLGAGRFDGAWLVQNFENQNPSNTLNGRPTEDDQQHAGNG